MYKKTNRSVLVVLFSLILLFSIASSIGIAQAQILSRNAEPDFQNLQVPSLSDPFEAGTYDDVDSRFYYSGDWVGQTGVSGAYQTTLHVSGTLGNSAKFQFIGSELHVFFQAGPSLGTIRLTLDTTSYIMNESSSSTQSYEWVLAATTDGLHTVTITHESGGAVNFDAIIVPVANPPTGTPTTKAPTILYILSDMPDPSEINQTVPVTVRLVDDNDAPVPNASVEISGADVNCQLTTNSTGTGSCPVRFDTAESKVISAAYYGDDHYLGSSDTEDHEVTVIHTVITILFDLPDPSIKDEQFVVAVRVTAALTPTGTVEIDGGQGVGCTILLSNGFGSCPLSYSTAGSKILTATYQPDNFTFIESTDTETHTVISSTPTPISTLTATATPTSTASPTPTPSNTPAPTDTIHIGDIDGLMKGSVQSWQATVIITVHNNNHIPVAHATVYGIWSRGSSGVASCVTNSAGRCILRSRVIGPGRMVLFTIRGVTYSTFPYRVTSNHDPDGSSNGTSIVIRR